MKEAGEMSDLTNGSVLKMLFRFAVPFMAANLLQSLYGAVDLFVVGKFCSPEGIAAVSIGTQVTQIITSLITGLTMASTILIGHYVGKKEPENAQKTVGTTVSAMFFTALLLTLLMLLFQKPLLRLLDTPAEAFHRTLTYITICAIGNVFICEYNAVSAILRGYGDSRHPLLFIGIACLLNVLLDVVLVAGFHLDVAGTAHATVISQGVSMVISFVYLKKSAFFFDFSLKNLVPRPFLLKKFVMLGIPVSFQELLVRISFLYIAFAINHSGLYASAIVGIGSKYDVFAMLTATSLAGALTAITAQNMGAGKPKRARKALVLCICFSLAASLGFFLWAQLSPATMIGVFTDDARIIEVGIPYFKTCSYDYLAVALLFCLNGYLNGKQKTVLTMLGNTVSALLLRMPLTYYVTTHFAGHPHYLGYIGTVAPAVTAFAALYTAAFVLFEGKRRTKTP